MISLVRWVGPPLLAVFVWVAVSPIRFWIYVLCAAYFVVMLIWTLIGLAVGPNIPKREANYRSEQDIRFAKREEMGWSSQSTAYKAWVTERDRGVTW